MNHLDVLQQMGELTSRGEFNKALELALPLMDTPSNELLSLLGFIYAQQQFSGRDLDKAMAFYLPAAEAETVHAQYGLGGILHERGQIKEALKWYRRAANNGNADCAFNAYRLSMESDDASQSVADLRLAASLGHAMARRELAKRYLAGREGVLGVGKGIVMYIKNLPDLTRWALEHAPRDDPHDMKSRK